MKPRPCGLRRGLQRLERQKTGVHGPRGSQYAIKRYRRADTRQFLSS